MKLTYDPTEKTLRVEIADTSAETILPYSDTVTVKLDYKGRIVGYDVVGVEGDRPFEVSLPIIGEVNELLGRR